MTTTTMHIEGRLRELEDVGYTVLEDVLPEPVVDDLSERAEALYRDSPKQVGVEPLHLVDTLERDERFVDLVVWPETLAVVSGALGENICVYHSHLDMHPPFGHRDYHWHQDIDLITRDCARLEAPICLKVGFFLSDVPSAEHGAMRVQPRTHSELSYDPSWEGIPVTVSRGSAVVFDHRVWHSRGLNTTPVTRAAFFVAYTYRWIRRRDELDSLPSPQDGRLDETVKELLHRLPPEGASAGAG